ncbi:MAG: DUF1549 domain-containing protein, partial [Planctomycetia bacterium]|nr:DUF1549 domain-containing protein [Planctomycetia bacterium]
MIRTIQLPGACGFALILALTVFFANCRELLADDSADIAFFEKRIRPVLVEHCYACHSGGAKIKGGLRLDSRDGWARGGDSGDVLVPGKPGESLLIEALRSEGDLKMPPKGKLPANIVADFEEWVKRGAPDPRKQADGKSHDGANSIAGGRGHWAYRPVAEPPIPKGRDTAWARTSIDRFVQSRLDAEGLAPGPPADREVLIRRLSFDLVGLPPSPQAIDDFLADDAENAWEKLVDRLLDAPEFGERWGRHWLDVARFAESLTLRGFVFKHAWRYRDYVIDAFNRDLPYDQFLSEQVAGDLLAAESAAERGRRLVATTVLVLGNTNLEEQDKQQLEMDLVDEQLDLIGRGFLAQTITCARCHDHKFDPIPTRDYYALAGILKNAKTLDHENVSKWIEAPLPLDAEREAVFRLHEEELAAVQGQIRKLHGEVKRLTGTPVAAGQILLVKDLPGIVVDDAAAKRVGEWQHSQHTRPYIGDGYLHDMDGGKGDKTLTFDPDLPKTGRYEVRLAYTPGGNRAEEVPVTVFSADGEKTIVVNERKPPPIDGRFITLGEYRFERDGQSFVIVSNLGTKGHVIADAVQFLPVEAAGAAAGAGKNEQEQPAPSESDEVQRLRNEIKRLEQDAQSRKAKGPKRPMVMTLTELPEPHDLFVHIRGSVHNRGPDVPRGFLEVASFKSAPAIPAAEGGRRQLAEWIASRDNPLTARVIVNRTWHWLFGAGIVRTTDNFGTTGEAPSHPELLDHLALTFMEDGWSIKKLVRRIVLSRTYELSSRDHPRGRAVDPDNRLVCRANRRRLDAECLRDAMLSISGTLKAEQGGATFPDDLAADYGYVDKSDRRSVYVPVFRNAIPEIFEAFDFADS